MHTHTTNPAAAYSPPAIATSVVSNGAAHDLAKPSTTPGPGSVTEEAVGDVTAVAGSETPRTSTTMRSLVRVPAESMLCVQRGEWWYNIQVGETANQVSQGSKRSEGWLIKLLIQLALACFQERRTSADGSTYSPPAMTNMVAADPATAAAACQRVWLAGGRTVVHRS